MEDDPHAGEEFGYVMAGTVSLHIGEIVKKIKKGDSFYFRPNSLHYIVNSAQKEAKILWVSTPPSF
jgi:quercetin dioxygenase-like cupin family protein